jgi:Protein of unknown function (DUF2490)
MKKITLLFIFISLGAIGYSQINTDVQLWAGFKYQVKFKNKLSLFIAPEIRLNNSLNTVKSIFPDLGMKYEINKSFSVGVGYRYSIRPNANDKNRVNVDFYYNLRKKKFPLSFTNRFRYQYARTSFTGKTEMYLREKIKFKYNLSKLVDPYVSTEIYFKLLKNEFRNLRFSVGLDWKINKRWSLSSFYIFQREIYVNIPSRDHIFGISGKYSMKVKKKKKSSSQLDG